MVLRHVKMSETLGATQLLGVMHAWYLMIEVTRRLDKTVSYTRDSIVPEAMVRELWDVAGTALEGET